MASSVDGWTLVVRNTFIEVDDVTCTPLARRNQRAKTWAALRHSSEFSTEDEDDCCGASSQDGASTSDDVSQAPNLSDDDEPTTQSLRMSPAPKSANDCLGDVRVTVRNTFVHVEFEGEEETLARSARRARTWKATAYEDGCHSGSVVAALAHKSSETVVESSTLEELVVACEDLPSIGSIGHLQGTCKPCAFGAHACRNGKKCEFCHLCKPVQHKKHGRWILKRRKQASELHSEMVARNRAAEASEIGS